MLLHAGDFSNDGQRAQIEHFNDFLGHTDFAHRVVIAVRRTLLHL